MTRNNGVRDVATLRQPECKYVADVVQAYVQAVAAELSTAPDESTGKEASLGYGWGGRVFALTQLWRMRPDLVPLSVVRGGMSQLRQYLGTGKWHGIGLYEGLCGIALSLNSANAVLREDSRSSADVRDIDEVLAEATVSGTDATRLDLFSGLSGLVLYATTLNARPTTKHLRRSILKRLSEIARCEAPALLALMAASDIRNYLGMAHGLAGLVAALLNAQSWTRTTGPLTQVINAGLRQLSAHAASASQRVRSNRDITWCWGDLSVAVLLAEAGVVLERKDLMTQGRDLGHLFATAIQDITLPDSSLCHGWSGATLGFRRLALTGGMRDVSLDRAAMTCLDRLGRAISASGGVAGLQFSTSFAPPHAQYRHSTSLLTGSGGVALALATAAWRYDGWSTVLGNIHVLSKRSSAIAHLSGNGGCAS